MTREDAKRELLFAKRNVIADSYIDQAYDVAIKALSEPEITHCKDCRFSQEDKLFGGYWCEGKEVEPNFFCADAKRKDESQPVEPEAEKTAECDAVTITDVDFDHTNEIFFNTKHGKVVKFVKARDEDG